MTKGVPHCLGLNGTTIPCRLSEISPTNNNLSHAAKIAAVALLLVQVDWRLGAQTVAIDTSPAGQQQVIDGFGTCLSGTEASQTTWWANLYYGDLQASLLRMDLTPNFKSPFANNNYNSPSYGNPGPGGNYVRTYTNATTYTNLFNGSRAPIAVMGPNINSNLAYFNFTASGSGPQVAGLTAQLGKSALTNLGDFKLFASLWSPMPWVKLTDGNTYQSGGANLPTNGTPFPFIWLGNFAGGSLDVSGTPRPEFNDSALGGTGPTSALTQFARCVAAYLRGFQNTFGVSFYAISIQNELDFDEFYNSCSYPLATNYVAALTAVRSELNQYPDLANIKIMGPEDVLGGNAYGMWQYGSGSTTADKNLQFLQAVGANPAARDAEAYFCIHGYDSDGVSAAAAAPTQWLWWVNGWSTSPAPGIPANVAGFSDYGKKSWLTETSGESPAWLYPASGFPSGGAWSLALRIQQALTAGRESAWAYWQMSDGSPVNTETLTDSSSLQNSPKYVAAKHFFKYIRPNAICVKATVSGDSALTAAAFLHATNGTMTVVLLNATNTPVQVVVHSPAQPVGLKSWQTFTSSDGSYWQTSSISITQGLASVGVPGYGVVTLYGLAPPRLTAALTAGGQLNLSWPPSANAFQLQSTTNLNSSWTAVGVGQITLNGLSNGLVNATLVGKNAARFFRLAQP